MKTHSMAQILDEVSARVEEYIDSAAWCMCSGDKLGLDVRAGQYLYVSKEGIVADRNNARTIDYYGGFEYVDPDYRQSIGEYTFYSVEDDRVASAVDHFFGVEGEEEEEV